MNDHGYKTYCKLKNRYIAMYKKIKQHKTNTYADDMLFVWIFTHQEKFYDDHMKEKYTSSKKSRNDLRKNICELRLYQKTYLSTTDEYTKSNIIIYFDLLMKKNKSALDNDIIKEVEYEILKLINKKPAIENESLIKDVSEDSYDESSH